MTEWTEALLGIAVGIPIGVILRNLTTGIEDWHGRHERDHRTS